MSPPERPRKITRNRQSLSCARCRLRKVRCTREHPECSNCVKVGEICTYGAHIQESADFPTSRPKIIEHTLDASISETSQSPVLKEVSASASHEAEIPIQPNIQFEEARNLNEDEALSPARISGHMDTRDPMRPRYLETTFWALVDGQVSVPRTVDVSELIGAGIIL